MKRIIGQATGIAAQILIIGLCSGCGAGSIFSRGYRYILFRQAAGPGHFDE